MSLCSRLRLFSSAFFIFLFFSAIVRVIFSNSFFFIFLRTFFNSSLFYLVFLLLCILFFVDFLFHPFPIFFRVFKPSFANFVHFIFKGLFQIVFSDLFPLLSFSSFQIFSQLFPIFSGDLFFRFVFSTLVSLTFYCYIWFL